MERYFNNEPDDDNDDEDSGEMGEFVKASKQDIMDVMQMELIEKELNQKLLEQAQQIASSDIFWAFRKDSDKIKRINRIYQKLKNIAAEE